MNSSKRKSRPERLIPLLVVCCLSLASTVHALTVAVFPVEDLSRGYNSVNQELTEYLQKELAAKNIDVIDPQAVIDFMGRNRIRWLGYLDTPHILAANKELQADLIVLGTVSQKSETRSPTFGLALNMVRTIDGISVWSASGGLSLMDMQTLLGINEPTSLAELWPVLAGSLVARLPGNVGTLLEPAVTEKESESLTSLSVSHVSLEPKFVRPGQEVKCAVEFTHLDKNSEPPQVFVRVGTKVHLARKTEEGYYYEANWTGSEVEQNIRREAGQSESRFAAKDFGAQTYEGLWPSGVEDDQYPVNLILRWPDGSQESMFVGSYTVDSTPPDFDLKMIGREIGGMVTFRDKLVMLSQFREREPIERWIMQIEKQNGKTILAEEGEGGLPQRFFWRGQDSNGFPVEDGIYRIILEAWDRSGNMKRVNREVVYRTRPPEITLEVAKKDDQLLVKLLPVEDIPIDYWQMEVWTGDNELLQMADGSQLPAEYVIPIRDGAELSRMTGTISMKDILGNRNSLAIKDLYLVAMQFFEPGAEEKSETAEKKEKPADSWASM